LISPVNARHEKVVVEVASVVVEVAEDIVVTAVAEVVFEEGVSPYHG
jgi:hypothetical protein